MKAWTAFRTEQHGFHVVPEDDIHPHYGDALCLCVPTRRYEYDPASLSEGGWIVTHNAWDGRERYEGPGRDFLADTLMAWGLGEMVSWTEYKTSSENAAQSEACPISNQRSL